MSAKPNHPLFGSVPAQTLPVLASVTTHLINRMLPLNHPWQERAQNDFLILADGVEFSPTVNFEMIDTVRSALKKAEVISEAPEAALLGFRVPDENVRATGNRLMAWVIAAALRRKITAPGENVIAAGLDATRLLRTRASAELARLEPFPETPEDLLKQLEVASEAENLPRKVRRYFERIAALIRAAHNERDPIFRQRSTVGEAEQIFVPPKTVATIDDVIEVTESFDLEDESFAGPKTLQEADQVTTKRVVLAKDDPNIVTPRPTAQRRVVKAARSAGRRDLALPAEQDILTPFEVEVLTKWLGEADWNSSGHATMFADLVFGTAHDLRTRSTLSYDMDSDRIRASLNAGFVKFDSLVEDNGLYRDPALYLPAPLSLIYSPSFGSEADEDVKEVLASLRPQLARPLTRRRVLRFKADWLLRNGADQATIGYLTGADPSGRAQMHYTVLQQQVLLDWHHRYLGEALGMDAPDLKPTTEFYGPELRLPRDLLRGVFEESRKDLRGMEAAGAMDFAQIVKAQNAFAVYTLMVLYFATGHRPVTHPFEFRTDFDLDSELLWVSDKEERGARGSRMLVLCPLALRQVRNWIAHLEKLKWRLSLTHPALEKASRAALSLKSGDHGPFFFLLHKDGKKAQPFRPLEQSKAMKPILPAALNWTRHVLRSALAENCDPAALDAFMGHGHLGAEPFANGSSLRLADLYTLAEKIETLLADHSVKAMESPL